jgi:hypothetical protein
MTLRSRWILFFALLLILIIPLATGSVFAYAIFVRHSDQSLVRNIATIFPVPAARVGHRTILYRDYLKDRDTARLFLASPVAKEQNVALPSPQEVDRNLLEKLITQTALEELAEQRHVAISEEDLRAFFADVVLAASGTTPDVGVFLLKNFGWDEADFRLKVLRPALLESRLQDALAKEQNGDQQALGVYLDQRMKASDVVRYLRF